MTLCLSTETLETSVPTDTTAEPDSDMPARLAIITSQSDNRDDEMEVLSHMKLENSALNLMRAALMNKNTFVRKVRFQLLHHDHLQLMLTLLVRFHMTSLDSVFVSGIF